VLQCVVWCCNVLQYMSFGFGEVEICSLDTLFVAVCCSVLQFVAVCYSVVQCVAVCCSGLQWFAMCCSVLQCVAVCCSVLQCVAVLCLSTGWLGFLGSIHCHFSFVKTPYFYRALLHKRHMSIGLF